MNRKTSNETVNCFIEVDFYSTFFLKFSPLFCFEWFGSEFDMIRTFFSLARVNAVKTIPLRHAYHLADLKAATIL